MAEWCYSKISDNSQKMTIPFIPANVQLESHAYYVFYSPIVVGANGVIWWMDNSTEAEKTNYTHQRAIYSDFTSERWFQPGCSQDSDETVLANGTDVGMWWSNRQGDSSWFTPVETNYPVLTTNYVDARAVKCSDRWRLFVVNHTNANMTFTCGIDDPSIRDSGYSNARDNGQTLHVMTAHPGLYLYYFSDSIDAYGYKIYDIGN
jgi:hypothetical protein